MFAIITFIGFPSNANDLWAKYDMSEINEPPVINFRHDYNVAKNSSMTPIL